MNRTSTILITLILLAGCGAGQKEKAVSTTTAADLIITSSAFTHGGEIPKKYGCYGESVSPPLSLSALPPAAKSLALIVTDPDAPRGLFTHWVVWNISPDRTRIGEGESPGGEEGTNSFGKTGYGAPCPPSGSHRYVFDVYALDTMLNLARGSAREDVERAMKGHVLAKGEIVGSYRK